jgi:hypothetical protein
MTGFIDQAVADAAQMNLLDLKRQHQVAGFVFCIEFVNVQVADIVGHVSPRDYSLMIELA